MTRPHPIPDIAAMQIAKKLLPLAAALAVGLAGAPAAACADPPQPRLRSAPLILATLRGPQAFTVEVAVTPEERACGLMGRPRLARGQGMLFRNRPAGPAYFWMKDTPQPLDLLFLDARGGVVHLVEFTTPNSTGVYGVDASVAAILAVKAGAIARLAVQPGDRVRHPWFKAD